LSAASASSILDKQAKDTVRTVSIRLPIENGARGVSSVQIEVARRSQLLEIRLTGSSQDLQRTVTESLDSLVQKLAVDRWAPESPAGVSAGPQQPLLAEVPRASLEPGVELAPRLPGTSSGQEIAVAARELPLDAARDATRGEDPNRDSNSGQSQEQHQQASQQDSRQRAEEEAKRAAGKGAKRSTAAIFRLDDTDLDETALGLQINSSTDRRAPEIPTIHERKT
jgi:hypothetical protein